MKLLFATLCLLVSINASATADYLVADVEMDELCIVEKGGNAETDCTNQLIKKCESVQQQINGYINILQSASGTKDHFLLSSHLSDFKATPLQANYIFQTHAFCLIKGPDAIDLINRYSK